MYRKPLIVFTPKSLLRHSKCVSHITSFAEDKFQAYIDDQIDKKRIEKIVVCSGKIFYELLARREKIELKKIAFIRIEQLYPLNKKYLNKIFKKYNYKEIIWVQEEPENMGAWSFIQSELCDLRIQLISRPPSAATATGSTNKSLKEQGDY